MKASLKTARIQKEKIEADRRLARINMLARECSDLSVQLRQANGNVNPPAAYALNRAWWSIQEALELVAAPLPGGAQTREERP